MKNRIIFISVLLLFLTIPLFANSYVSDKDYKLKAGDILLINTINIDTFSVKVPISINGDISLFPITDNLMVADKSMSDAKELITSQICKELPNAKVAITLLEASPINFHITGEVEHPGEYSFKTNISLFKALTLAEGLLPIASKKISIARDDEILAFDLGKYIVEGDISQNPIILHDDIIMVNKADRYVKIFVNNDTINILEYVEINDQVQIKDALELLSNKNRIANYSDLLVLKDGKKVSKSLSEIVSPGDSIFVSKIETSVYVTGNVSSPGRYSFNGKSNVEYYISLAGGVTNIGNANSYKIIKKNGVIIEDDDDYQIKPGDTIHIPESFGSSIRNYLGTLSIIASVISTIVVVSRK